MGIDKELIDKLLADYKGPENLIGEQGLLKQLNQGSGQDPEIKSRAFHFRRSLALGAECRYLSACL